MARKKIASRCTAGGQWLYAYAGTVTVLLAVLLLLLSMSALDVYRFNTLVSHLMQASGKSVKITANAAVENGEVIPREAEAGPDAPGLRELSANIEEHQGRSVRL